MQFECHLTLVKPLDSFKVGQIEAIAYDLGPWTSSEIARDPALGKDTYFYLTAHSDNLVSMYDMMEKLVNRLSFNGFETIRQKIEMTIYDSKATV